MQNNFSCKVNRCPYYETEWNYNFILHIWAHVSEIKKKIILYIFQRHLSKFQYRIKIAIIKDLILQNIDKES